MGNLIAWLFWGVFVLFALVALRNLLLGEVNTFTRLSIFPFGVYSQIFGIFVIIIGFFFLPSRIHIVWLGPIIFIFFSTILPSIVAIHLNRRERSEEIEKIFEIMNTPFGKLLEDELYKVAQANGLEVDRNDFWGLHYQYRPKTETGLAAHSHEQYEEWAKKTQEVIKILMKKEPALYRDYYNKAFNDLPDFCSGLPIPS